MWRDREQAGEALARELRRYRDSGALVVALPRGGVPVAAAVADRLGLALDICPVRKVGLPGHEELAVAAVAGPDGSEMVVNREIAAAAGLDDAALDRLATPEREELERRRLLYRAGRETVAGRDVILVDDGVATGATTRAALAALRRAGAARLVLAVPVAAPETLARLEDEADEVVCLASPEDFRAVGLHYMSFPQVPDEAVLALLDRSAAAPDGD